VNYIEGVMENLLTNAALLVTSQVISASSSSYSYSSSYSSSSFSRGCPE